MHSPSLEMKKDFISNGLVLDTFEPFYPKRQSFTSLCNRFSVFSEMPAGISGRKNCNEAILCSRRASSPSQKSLLGPAKPALRIEIGGVNSSIPPSGFSLLIQQPLYHNDGQPVPEKHRLSGSYALINRRISSNTSGSCSVMRPMGLSAK